MIGAVTSGTMTEAMIIDVDENYAIGTSFTEDLHIIQVNQ